MTIRSTDAYVDAALALQGFNLAPVAVEGVKEQFSRIAALAAGMLEEDLPPSMESAALLIPGETRLPSSVAEEQVP